MDKVYINSCTDHVILKLQEMMTTYVDSQNKLFDRYEQYLDEFGGSLARINLFLEEIKNHLEEGNY
jgi:hypothetical protein